MQDVISGFSTIAGNTDEEAYAEWNKGLEAIEPLIEYNTRLMGQLSGRLMTAQAIREALNRFLEE